MLNEFKFIMLNVVLEDRCRCKGKVYNRRFLARSVIYLFTSNSFLSMWRVPLYWKLRHIILQEDNTNDCICHLGPPLCAVLLLGSELNNDQSHHVHCLLVMSATYGRLKFPMRMIGSDNEDIASTSRGRREHVYGFHFELLRLQNHWESWGIASPLLLLLLRDFSCL